MNRRKFIINERSIIVVGCISTASSGLYAFILGGGVRLLLGMGERFCLIWIGLPAFIVLLIVHVVVLPKHLQKAELID